MKKFLTHILLFFALWTIVSGVPALASEYENDAVYEPFSAKKHPEKKKWPEQDWGAGFGFRVASVPFLTDDDMVTDFIPKLYFKNHVFYIDGLEAGVRVYRHENSTVYCLGRLRFSDIPEEYQDKVRQNSLNFGVQFQFVSLDTFFWEIELLTDKDFRSHSNIRVGLNLDNGKLQWEPFINAEIKSAKFNDYYFGLNRTKIGGDMDCSIGVEAEYHLISHLYLTGSFKLTRLGENTHKSQYVDKTYLDESFLGIKISNDIQDIFRRKKDLRNMPYLRVAHGWATPSNLRHIICGDIEKDEYENQFTSLFYGYPLTDTLFGVPVDIYLTPGFVWHWHSDVQGSSQEYVVAMKAYYTFTWPVVWRFGFAEGMSYVRKITYLEDKNVTEKGYDNSRLMNYLDFSLDMNLSKLFKIKDQGEWWLGYSIHHRSSIFESASQFGRIKGGSNYNTVYVQYHF